MKIAINGFGRIGRAVYRILSHQKEIEIAAINDIAKPEPLAYLLKYDTVMGKFEGEISIFRFYDTLLTPSDVQSLYSDVFVPEPSACVLGLVALTALGLATRRRRRR